MTADKLPKMYCILFPIISTIYVMDCVLKIYPSYNISLAILSCFFVAFFTQKKHCQWNFAFWLEKTASKAIVMLKHAHQNDDK